MFGGLKILVLHGDPESLAGWGLAHESFSAANESVVLERLRATDADAIACTHICLPVLWSAVSDAAASYRRRILQGTSLCSEQVVFSSDT